jgi:hypothetical protein
MTQNTDSCTQLTLDLFPAPSFEDLLSVRHIKNFSVVSSRRLRRGWYAKINAHTGARCLVTPEFLKNAPQDVKSALIDWTFLQNHGAQRKRKKTLEQVVFGFIRSNGLEHHNRSRFDPLRYVTLGRIYDLKEVFDTLNKLYYNGMVTSFLRWGSHPLRSYQSIKYDGDGVRYNLITIGSMYNRPGVPRYAIEGIMYHEMLHIAHPPKKSGGRNIIHGPGFKQKERLYPGFSEWTEWEKINAHRTYRKD